MYYSIGPAETETAVYVDAAHRWGLPGVACNACDEVWAMTGIAYPSIDLTGQPWEAEYRLGGPVAPHRFDKLAASIARWVGRKDLFLRPGTALGPLFGRAQGHVGEIAWLNPWTLLVTKNVLKKLATVATKPLVGVAARLAELELGLIELEIPVAGRLLATSRESCSTCGRVKVDPSVFNEISAEISVEAVPEGLGLFRLSNFPTFVVAHEQIVDHLAAADPSGCVATPNWRWAIWGL